MSDFKAKKHQMRYPLGLRPRFTGGAYCAPQILAVFTGPTSKRRGRRGEGRAWEGKVKGRKGERGGGRIWTTQTFWRGAPML